MENKTAAQKVAKVIVFGFVSLVVLSLLLLLAAFWSAEWRSRVAIAFALFTLVSVGYGVYLRLLRVHQTEIKPQLSTGEQLERRGSPILGMVRVRDDDFERQLNWLREHKHLVKIIEKIAISILLILGLIALVLLGGP